MKAQGLGGCSCWEVRAERGEAGDTEEKESHVEGSVETCVQLGETLALSTLLMHHLCPSLPVAHLYSTKTYQKKEKNICLSWCILVELGQHP